MSKRNIIIIIIIVIVLVIAAVILIQKDKPIPDPASLDQGKVSEEISSETEKQKEQVDQTAILKSQLGLQARSFIARYGTYSSDSGYSNLKELLPQMSEKLAAEILTRIQQGPSFIKAAEGEFFTLVTKVLSLNIKEIDPESKAVFLIQIQEQQMKSSQTDIFYKLIELIFIKDGNEWKVDEIKTR